MNQQLCMFCGQPIRDDELTMEHFVPKGLWEKGKHPVHTRTLPAHKECNQAFSLDNEYFRDVLLFEEGVEQHPKAREVQQGAIARKMMKKFGSILRNIKKVGLRRVHTPAGIDLGYRPTFEVEWDRIERVLCNVIKGVFYVSQHRPLPEHFLISVSDVHSVDPEWLTKTVDFMCPWQSFGDTVFCCRYVRSSKDPITKFTCLMQFYEHRLFIGEALDPQLVGQDGDLFVPAEPNSKILVPRWSANR